MSWQRDNYVFGQKKASSHSKSTIAFSTTADGNMSFVWGKTDEVVNNRKKFLQGGNISLKHCIAMDLQHGTDILHVDSSKKGFGMLTQGGVQGDCLISNERRLFLFMLTGDCLPIIIHDQQRGIIALAHISRRNTNQLFAKTIIRRMIADYGCQVSDLKITIGPCIHKESYIKKNVPEQTMTGWSEFITKTSGGSVMIDLLGYNIQQLVDAGIARDRINVSSIDTAQSNNYYSHRRSVRNNEPEGRFATVAGMV